MFIQRDRSWIMKGALGAACFAGLGWWMGSARAGSGIPTQGPLHYAGSLFEQGIPVQGARDITIVLWNDQSATAPANVMCTTATQGTSVTQGRFVVTLAAACTGAVQSNADLWVEIQVGGVSFGRQYVGASPYSLMAGAVNGLVQSTGVVPSFAPDGQYGRGAGGASIYNDGTSTKALVLTGNNSNDGAVHVVSVNDDLWVSRNATVNAALNVTNDVSVGGHVQLQTHVVTASATTEVSCPPNEYLVAGGASCHISPDDQLMFESYPKNTTTWHANCANHDNSGNQEAPVTIYALCMKHGI